MSEMIIVEEKYKLSHTGEQVDDNIDEVIDARGEYPNLSERLNNIGGGSGGVGESTTGQTFTIDGTEVVADTGAERFNDYENNKPTGKYSHTEGNATTASGDYSHAEGQDSAASGVRSHAEGYQTTALGDKSHAEGDSDKKQSDVIAITSSTTDDEIISAHTSNKFSLAKGAASHVEGAHCLALKDWAHAEGNASIAQGLISHAEGYGSQSVGEGSHAEGYQTKSLGQDSHAEGYMCNATGIGSHAEGYESKALGTFAHAEGYSSEASGPGSHSEGNTTKATQPYAHAEGTNTTASGYQGAHAEGDQSVASGNASHAEGTSTTASGTNSHSEGGSTEASGSFSHAENNSSKATGDGSHAEGGSTTASGVNSHSEGNNATAFGDYSHTEGHSTVKQSDVVSVTSSTTDSTITNAWNSEKFSLAKGIASHVEGNDCLGLGDYSHAEGDSTKASGDYSHAEGDWTTASGNGAHAEGNNTIASGDYSHAEGDNTTASENTAHAEGYYNTASGIGSHAEGNNTRASGPDSHAEGSGTIASGEGSHAEGYDTKASSDYQHVQGKYNVEDTASKFAFIIGNGTSATERSNAIAIDWNGLIYVNNASTGVNINLFNLPENHNAIFRGDDLFAKGYTIDDICTMISDGSFSDIYMGDYFPLSGTIENVPCYVEQTDDEGTKTLVESTQTVTYNTKFRVAGLDTYLNTGDTAFTQHHAVIVPDDIIGSNRMNSSDTTTGGYTGSFMCTSVLPVYDTHFSNVLNNHLLSHREILSTSISDWSWTDVKMCLMSEPELYGLIAFGGKYDVGINYRKFPLFDLAPKYICNRNYHWLRAVSSSAYFAYVNRSGSTATTMRPMCVACVPALQSVN